jgi:hypothetical protein
MGWTNAELVRVNHGSRHHATELVAILRGAHIRPPDATTPLVEVARLTRSSWAAERRVGALEHQTAMLQQRATSAEAELGDWRDRAGAAEQQLSDARSLLGTRRARTGIAIGRVLDRMRGRG